MQPTFAQAPFSAWNVGFICGGLAAQVNRRIPRLDPAALFAGGLALILLSRLCSAITDLFVLAPGIGCIVLALVRSERANAQSVAALPMRILFLLGECSYGLYLAHSLGIQIALQYVPTSSNPGSVFVAMIGAGLAIGLAAGGIDVLLYRYLKQRIDRRGASSNPATAVAAKLEVARFSGESARDESDRQPAARSADCRIAVFRGAGGESCRRCGSPARGARPAS
jgi:peptidoglycan/LPS O-acetylase OafA/YrhL